jgi:arylsulfatase
LARWLGATVKEFLTTIPQYPFQEGSSMNPSNVNYMTLKAAAALHQLEMMSHPHN